MSWNPSNRFQQAGGYNNQFPPRPHFAPRPRFESRFRGPGPNFSGSRNLPPYGPRAVGSYRTSRPFHNQSRPFRPQTTRTPAPTTDGIKSESQSTRNKDKEEKSKENEEQKVKAEEPTVNQNDSEKSVTVKVGDPGTSREDANSKEPVTVSEDAKSGQLDDSETEQQGDVDIRTSGNALVTEQKEQTLDTSADNDKVIAENKRTEVCEDTDSREKIATEVEQSTQVEESDKSVRNEDKSKDDNMPKDTDKNEAKPTRNDAEENNDDDGSSDEDTGFCKYCQKSFSSTAVCIHRSTDKKEVEAYYTHTRGIIHINMYMKAKEEKQIQTTVSASSERAKDSGKAQDAKQFLSAEETKQKSEQHNKQLSGASRDSKTFSEQDQDKKGTQNATKTGQLAHSDRSEFISSEEQRQEVVKSDKSWTEIADRLISETGFNFKQKQNSGRVDHRRLSSGPNNSQRFEKRPISRQSNKHVEDSGVGQFGLALSDVGSGSGDDDEHKVGQFDSVSDFGKNYERDKTNYSPVEKYIDKADREKVQLFGSVHDRSYVKETNVNVYGESSEGKAVGQFYGNEGPVDNSQSYNYDSQHPGFKQTNSYSGQSDGQGSTYSGQMQEYSNTYPGLGRGQSQSYRGRGRGQGGSYQEQGSRYPDLSGRQDTSYKGRGRGQGFSYPGQGDRYTDKGHGQDSSYQGKGYRQGESYQGEDFEQAESFADEKYTGNNYEKGDSYGDTYRKGFEEGDSYVRERKQDDYQSGKDYEQGGRYSGKRYHKDNNYQADIHEQDYSYQGESSEQNNRYQGEGYEQGDAFEDGKIDNVYGDYSGGDYNDVQDDYNNYQNSGPTDGKGNYNNAQDEYYNDGNDDPYYGRGDYYDGQDDYYNKKGDGNDGQGNSDRGQFYAIAGYKTKQSEEFREEEVTNIEEVDEEEEEDEDEDEDTSYCKYCKLPFSSSVAYHAHTRGLQHTTLIMEEKRKKGDHRFRKETVAPEVLKVEIPKPQPKVNLEIPDIPDDYDFETNWMNLDDELIKRLQKTKASQRDLTPDDIGKKQFSDDFSCALCNVQCTSALTFKMHIEGKQHKNNLERLESGTAVKRKKTPGVVFTSVEGDDVEPQFNALIANYTENALMGLEYLTEFQKPDPKAPCRYVCNLCEAKCDGSTILAHVIGVKHKLCYFREKHFKLYEHLTKYTSKKKRSEMNEHLEDFARQIEAEEGRGKVRVKIELEAGCGEENLNEIMTRMSKALKEKMVEIEQGTEAPSKPLEGKKGQFALPKEALQKPEKKTIKPPPKASEALLPASVRKERSPLPVGPRYGPPSRPPPPLPQRSYFDSPQDPYGAEPYRPGSYGREDRADPYSRDRFADRRDTFEYERESDYLDMMLDKYRYSDPFLERRRLEDLIEKQRRLREFESRRLDDLLLDRHRLVDPTLETRRLEDILQRKRKIEEAERLRFEDIMRRKRLLEENDIEKLRIQRYEKLMKTSQEQDVTAAREVERPSLEELIARRRIKNLAAAQENRPLADASLLPNSYSASVEAQSAVPRSVPLYHQSQIAPTPVSVQAAGPVTVSAIQNAVQSATAVGMQGTSQVVTGIGANVLSQIVTGSGTQWAGQGVTGLVGQGPSQVVTAFGGQGPSQVVAGLGLQGPSQVATIPGGVTQQSASGALSTAQKVVANKELQEELAKNPGVNIGELLGNLSSSMIATEDDAAMALQISNTLTQALLKFRLQHATKQLSEVGSQSKKSESKSIPGLGSSAPDSGKSVPSFLRTVTGTPKPKVQTPTSSVSKSSDSREAHFSPQNISVSVTDSKKARQIPQEASQPQTDLLKSIREQAQQLQAQISSRVKTSASVSQSGIQTQSQFVHGQTTNYGHTPTSSADRQIYVSGKKSQESKDTASPSQTKSTWERQIYMSGKKTSGGSQDTASSVSQTTSSTDRHVYLSGKKSTGGPQYVDMSQTTPSVERHVHLSGTKSSHGSQETTGPSQMAPSTGNPATHVPYDQWYSTMYGQSIYSYYPTPAPPVLPGVPPPPPPTS